MSIGEPIPELSPSRPGNIRQFRIKGQDVTGFDNESGTRTALVDLRYYENVLSPSVTFSVGIKETDNLLDSLPIKGGEKCDIILEDSQNGKLNLSLYVNRVRNVIKDPLESNYFLDLTSEESFANDQSRVVKRYDGKISDSVESILKQSTSGSMGIKTSKNVKVDKTLIKYNFIGNNKKPFTVCTWLASKSVPENAGKSGGAAGYLFYETQDGFNFRSIDALFKEQKPKRKLIFTGTPDQPIDYNTKIINYSVEKNIDLKNNLTLGTYSNESIFFDFYDFKYRERSYSVDEGGVSGSKDKLEHGGKDNFDASVTDKFRSKPSRIMTRILDVGTLPEGKSSKEQLENWKNHPDQPTFDAAKVMVQSAMRYNQLYSIKINVLIAGDFSLRAGDLVSCDFSQVNPSTSVGIDKRSSGIYMIASVCHRLTSKHTTSNLTLVRDTFGRKPI
jgi:hypothetical protein|tara:strand:+ start:631 stop:1968 length:1338 start_codon:yes stop_codon:yes gene_type:complete